MLDGYARSVQCWGAYTAPARELSMTLGVNHDTDLHIWSCTSDEMQTVSLQLAANQDRYPGAWGRIAQQA